MLMNSPDAIVDKQTCLGVIPARGGSKGLPGKNIRLLDGKPLIEYSIEAALKSGCVTRVVVSTDDESIAHVARLAGAEVPFYVQRSWRRMRRKALMSSVMQSNTMKRKVIIMSMFCYCNQLLHSVQLQIFERL